MECQTCRAIAHEISLTEGPRIDLDEHWMLEHCHPVSMPGWLVLVLKRHARALHELTDAEGEALGHWLTRVTRAMHTVTGCEVEYAIQLAEGAGFHHVHVHLMARRDDWPTELRGPRVFEAFGADPRVTAEQQTAIIDGVRAALAAPPVTVMRIGVTGHRRFDGVDEVAKHVERELDAWCADHPGAGLEVWSSLAEGADRLVADLLLRRGAVLVALLPLPVTDYRTDFADEASLAEFDRLLATARDVRVARPVDPTRDAAYEAAGLALIEAVDVLVALWDGAAPRGRGGTAEIVAAARRSGCEVVVVPVTRDNV